MGRQRRSVVGIPFLSLLCLATLLGQGPTPAPAEPATNAELAASLVTRAKALEDAGQPEQALSAYAAAAALDPAHAAARESLSRLMAAPIAPAAPPGGGSSPLDAVREERTRRQALEETVRQLSRTVDAQTAQIRKLTDDLSDKGRADPITDRLDRDVRDLERQVDRQSADLARLQRQVDGVQRDVDRVRSQPR